MLSLVGGLRGGLWRPPPYPPRTPPGTPLFGGSQTPLFGGFQDPLFGGSGGGVPGGPRRGPPGGEKSAFFFHYLITLPVGTNGTLFSGRLVHGSSVRFWGSGKSCIFGVRKKCAPRRPGRAGGRAGAPPGTPPGFDPPRYPPNTPQNDPQKHPQNRPFSTPPETPLYPPGYPPLYPPYSDTSGHHGYPRGGVGCHPIGGPLGVRLAMTPRGGSTTSPDPESF